MNASRICYCVLGCWERRLYTECIITFMKFFIGKGKVSHTIPGLWDKPGEQRMRGGMSSQLKASTGKLAANQKEILSLYCCQFGFGGEMPFSNPHNYAQES